MESCCQTYELAPREAYYWQSGYNIKRLHQLVVQGYIRSDLEKHIRQVYEIGTDLQAPLCSGSLQLDFHRYEGS